LRISMLVGVWLALWGDVSAANVLSGILVATAVTFGFAAVRSGTVVVRPLRVARFVLLFVYKLIEASLVVARTVVAPRHRIHSGIIAVPLQDCSDAIATLVADAISLTPGTLTLDVRRQPLTLFIHALDVRDH